MAWKTGTSFGHRDAWTFAYTPEYTVGVWMGNFSGRPARALVGVEAAAPVATRIMEQLYAGKTPPWYPMPDSVAARKVCALSGMPGKDICAAQTTDYYIRGVSSDLPCSVHVQAPEGIVEAWPVELAAWFRSHGQDREARAAGNPRCPPKIVSPASRQTYVLADASAQRVLLKAASGDDRVYWFIDDTLYRACSPSEQTFWPLRPGTHKIVCADEGGRAASVVIDVQ
jgi:penicillin-binding protein 1C